MEKEFNKIEDNVNAFLDKCSKEVGKYEEEVFSQNIFCELLESEVKSPIEQLLYVALHTVMRLNDIEEGEPINIDGKNYVVGLRVDPQWEVGKYRVDFRVSFDKYPRKGQQESKEVLVECDSQVFHDRSEKERRFEKARDRYLQINGYKVFRFTGSEIYLEPLRVAAEIIAFVTGLEMSSIQQDSNMEQ